jgi:hypothetical protein
MSLYIFTYRLTFLNSLQAVVVVFFKYVHFILTPKIWTEIKPFVMPFKTGQLLMPDPPSQKEAGMGVEELN